MKPKTPSADQGPPAKTGFETEDHPPSQTLEWNQTCAYQSHGTEEIFAAIQSLNSQKKTQELPAVLWEGDIKYNTGGAETPPRQNGRGAPQKHPWSTRMREELTKHGANPKSGNGDKNTETKMKMY